MEFEQDDTVETVEKSAGCPPMLVEIVACVVEGIPSTTDDGIPTVK